MNTIKTSTNMELLCIKEKSGYLNRIKEWGSIFQRGKKYKYKNIENQSVAITTNIVKHYDHISKLESIVVSLPFISVIGEDGKEYNMCSLTKKEIVKLHNINLEENGDIPFRWKTYLCEEFFQTKSEIRDKILDKLGI
jgi:hypothetical protein